MTRLGSAVVICDESLHLPAKGSKFQRLRVARAAFGVHDGLTAHCPIVIDRAHGSVTLFDAG
jgi:hypothetical protein